MRVIDVHAHLAPQILWQAFANGEDWHGMSHEARGEQEFIVGNGKRILINSPKIRYKPEERLADMDTDGTPTYRWCPSTRPCFPTTGRPQTRSRHPAR